MKNALLKSVGVWVCMWVATWACAQEGFVQLDIGRDEARLPVYVIPNPGATASLILLPGGDAGTGKIADGQPGSANFLSRTRGEFHAANFNVLVVYRASDLNVLDYGYRISNDHVGELARVISYARQRFGKPVWLVGTSRGTVSATAAAIALGETEVQGVVLASSVTSSKPGAISSQHIASIKMPVLVVHHKNDACRICVPAEASRITSELKSGVS